MTAITTTDQNKIEVSDFRNISISKTCLINKNEVNVAIAQIGTEPGQIDSNVEKIKKYILEAKAQGADIIVFPELTIPSYASMDLFWNKFYLAENLNAVEKLKEFADGITVVVGFADVDKDSIGPNKKPVLYNSLAIIQNREIVAIQDKTLLPEYDIFYEKRYFEKGRGHQTFELKGLKFGAEICEDMWTEGYKENPTEDLLKEKVDVVINSSASPYHFRKYDVRNQIIENIVEKHEVDFIYANVVGAYDALYGQAVFDGRSRVLNKKGDLIATGKGFREELIILNLYRSKKIEAPRIAETKELKDALILGLRQYVERHERESKRTVNKFIVGVSGGIDSAVVLALAVEAFGKDRVLAVTMPSKYSSDETKSDAYKVAENLGVEIDTIPIVDPYNTFIATLNSDPRFKDLPENVAEENVQARLRMMYLMWYSNKIGGMVLGTGNKTELALNNCTVFGDMVGSITVLGDVDKDRVYDIAELQNEEAAYDVVPEKTISRPPTAELKGNQSDADVMGAEPRIIAPLVRAIIEEQLTVREAIDRFENEFSREVIFNTFARIDGGEWKRRLGPQAIRVTSHAFGDGRRIPIENGLYRHEIKKMTSEN